MGPPERGSSDQDRQAQLPTAHGQDGAENEQPSLPTTTIFLAKTAARAATAEPEEGANPGTKVGRALLTSGLLLPRRRDGPGEDLLI